MEVIALVGPSGTGKSHRALVVAHENNVECIIDDGILIYRNRIVAGFSAKKEESKLKAVRRAIFQDPVQVEAVRKKLEEIQPQRLLILGTSENMVGKIAKAIQAPAPSRYIHIEEIATPKEIEKAQHARLKEGKHIIPVPTMELKPHFQGYLIDPIKSMWRRTQVSRRGSADTFEKSVVRPVFSYYGKLTFSDQVIESLIKNGLDKVKGIAGVASTKIRKSKKGANGLLLELDVLVEYGFSVKDLMKQAQQSIRQEIEYITGMSVERLALTVKDVVDKRKH